MEFHLFSGVTGSEVTGVDARKLIPDTDIEHLQFQLAERGVLVLPGQSLTSQEQVNFTSQFGEIESFPDQSRLGNSNQHIFRVSNQGDGYNVGHYWHADRSPYPHPTAISTLLAVHVPAVTPARTLFLNMQAAYEGLSQTLKDEVATLRWETSTRVPLALVRSHPITGKPILSLPFRFPGVDASGNVLVHQLARLNSDLRPRVVGYHQTRSEELILLLLHHLLGNPEWVFTHSWNVGDLVLWDQRTACHQATVSDERRVLTRTAVEGRQAPAYASALQAEKKHPA